MVVTKMVAPITLKPLSGGEGGPDKEFAHDHHTTRQNQWSGGGGGGPEQVGGGPH